MLKKDGGKDRKGDFSMKKVRILMVALIAVIMAVGLILVSCKDEVEVGGCIRNGKCRVMTNPDANGAYEFCGDSSCAVGKVPYPVPPNMNVSCDCN